MAKEYYLIKTTLEDVKSRGLYVHNSSGKLMEGPGDSRLKCLSPIHILIHSLFINIGLCHKIFLGKYMCRK